MKANRLYRNLQSMEAMDNVHQIICFDTQHNYFLVLFFNVVLNFILDF